MITIPQPSMALNAVDPWDKKYTVPKPRYEMEFSRNVRADLSPQDVFENVKHIGSLTKEGKLKYLVINCHGQYFSNGTGGAALVLGTGIDFTNDFVFARLSGIVDGIYIVACGFGQNQALCSSIASYANAVVFAATKNQRGNNPFQALFNVPKNRIDRCEGNLYEFRPDGTNQLVTQAGSRLR